jgi:hypothetical protein
MIIEDTNDIKPLNQLPHFTCIVRPYVISGQPYALWMNHWIISALAGKTQSTYPILSTADMTIAAQQFLIDNFGSKRAVPAGKNVAGFDMQFLPQPIKDCFIHRSLDPGTLCIDWENDSSPPSLDQIKAKLGIPGAVTHDMYEDALDVIKVFRHFYRKET